MKVTVEGEDLRDLSKKFFQELEEDKKPKPTAEPRRLVIYVKKGPYHWTGNDGAKISVTGADIKEIEHKVKRALAYELYNAGDAITLDEAANAACAAELVIADITL